MFKMTWALIAEYADEWTGDSYDQAAAVLSHKVTAAVSESGMSPEAQAGWLAQFLAPIRDQIPAARPSVEVGGQWDKAAGPLLVVLTPTA